MKRIFAFLLIFALLCTACGAQTQTNAETTTAATASTGTAAQTAAPDSVDALNDPTDDSKDTTDDFTVTSENGEITQDGSVYTITAAGEYTLSGLLSDGQIAVDAGDGDEIKLILNNASIACSTGAPILMLSPAALSTHAA